MPQVAAALKLPPEQLLAESERLLAALADKAAGTWLPADARVAYHRAQLFSALDALVQFYADNHGTPERVAQVSALFAGGKGTLAPQFDRYAKDVVRAQQRKLPVDELTKDVRELRELGLGAVRRLQAKVALAGSGAAGKEAWNALVERCDSRLECRALLGDIAYYDLRDPVTDEVLRASVIAEGGAAYARMRLRHLHMERDRAGFLAAIRGAGPCAGGARGRARRSPRMARGERSAACVRRARLRGEDELRGERRVRELVDRAEGRRARAARDRRLPAPCQGRSRARVDGARAGASAHVIAARTTRARALQASGKLKEAWAELEPLLASKDPGVMLRAAHVKLAAGDADAAIALAKQRLESHKDAVSVSLLAQLLWQADKTADAAAVIAENANVLALPDFMGPLGAAFAAAFRDRPAEAGANAFKELLAKRVDEHGLRGMIRGQELPPELAFRTYSQIQGTGDERPYEAAVSYTYFKAWKDEKAAREWIEQAVPADQREPLALYGYAAGAHELVWDLVADPKPDSPQAPFVWLLRTAALLRSAAPPPEWRRAARPLLREAPRGGARSHGPAPARTDGSGGRVVGDQA